MSWHKKWSLLLWKHHQRSFWSCLLIQPAIWKLPKTIIFVAIGNFCSEVHYVGMFVISKRRMHFFLSFTCQLFIMMPIRMPFNISMSKNLISESRRCSGFQFCCIMLCLIVPLCLKISVYCFTVNFCILSQSHGVNMSMTLWAQKMA